MRKLLRTTLSRKDKAKEALKKLYKKLARDHFQLIESMCISVLKKQITSFEVIALGKVYPSKTKKLILGKNLLLLQLLLKGTQFSQLHDL